MALAGFTSLMRSVFDQGMMRQFYPPTATFQPERDIPSLTGQVVLVTGGNGGIGYETCKHLLLKEAKVYMAARRPDAAKEAAARLLEETGRAPEILILDLGDLESVRKGAEEFKKKEPVLHRLYNNAGAVWVPTEMLTKQGYDLAFGTNVVGHYFFTILLMPILEHTFDVTGVRPRILNVSSSAHVVSYGATGITWPSITDSSERSKIAPSMGSYALYCQSKFGVILLSYLLDRHYGQKVLSIALNPGNFESGAYRYLNGAQKNTVNLVLYTVEDGCKTQLWAGTAPEGNFTGGDYLIPWALKGTSDPRTHNTQTQDELWTWLQKQCEDF
ncbi:NAD-P-binding protein [Peniophora sp. CONT]|nr:NAD-P-binding protein [Peniophora sp. CONT]